MMRGGVADPTVVGSSLKLRHLYLRYFVVDCKPSKFLIYVARKNISTLCFLIIYNIKHISSIAIKLASDGMLAVQLIYTIEH